MPVDDITRAGSDWSYSARSLAAIADAMSDGMIVINAEGRILEVNRRFLEMTGFPASALVGTVPPYAYWPPEDADASAARIQRVLTAEPGPHRATFMRRNGDRFPIEASATRMVDGDEQWIVGLIRDVSHETDEHARLVEALVAARLTSWEWDPCTGDIRVFGPPQVAFPARTADDVFARIPGPDGPRIEADLRSLAARGDGTYAVEHALDLSPDERIWVVSQVRAVPARDRSHALLRGTTQDITKRRLAEHDALLRARLLDEVAASVVTVDGDGTVTSWNRGAERLFGYTREQALGRRMRELVVPATDEALAAAAAAMEIVYAEGRWSGSFELRRRDDTRFVAQVEDILIRGDDGTIEGVIGIAVDISERVAFEREIAQARDHIQAIADSVGEGLVAVDGDGRLTYLNRVAEQLLGVRGADIHGAVMHDLVHACTPDGTALPIEDCPITRSRVENRQVHVDDDVFLRADGTPLPVEYTAAPFSVGDGSRGCVVVFEDITHRKSEEQRLRREIETLTWNERVRSALEERRFVVYAQPIVELASGTVVQRELLVRLVDAGGEVIPPGEFLPAVERSGLVRQIDRWMVTQAFALVPVVGDLHVNVSAASLGDPRFADHVTRTAREADTDPACVVFEITETALVEDEAMGAVTVGRLADLGCRIALDDFGTGYGGFTYVKRLPVDLLKIDREFVRDLISNPASRAVVRSVVALARDFGLATLAEGIEDEATRDALLELGVTLGQGFLFGHPEPVASPEDA